MKLKKLAALCKRAGTLRMVYKGSTLFAGTDKALYKLPNSLPVIHNSAELIAVLGYTDKEADKLYPQYDDYNELKTTTGLCLDDAWEGERICDESYFDLVAGESVLRGLECDDATMGFIDVELLAPVEDKIGAYTEFYRRQMPTGNYYYVIKDGMEMLAMITPMQVLSTEFAQHLRGMSNMVYRALYGDSYTSKYMGVPVEKAMEGEEKN